MKRRRYIAMLAVMVGLLVMEPAQADFSLTNLFKGEGQTTSASTEMRAKGVPALRYIPIETSGVVAAGGDCAPAAAAALVEDLCVEETGEDAAQSVGSFAVSIGKGGEQSCREFFSMQRAVEQLVAISRMKQYFSSVQNGSVQNAAQASLQASYNERMSELKERLRSLHVAPVYVVFTAAAGKEEGFRQFVEQIEKRLAAQTPGWSSCEQGQMLELPWNTFMERAIDALQLSGNERSELLSELATHKLYVLTQRQPGVFRIVLVTDKPEAPWPTEDAQSMLAAPELSGMDAHAGNIQLAVWMPAEIQSCLEEFGGLSGPLEPMQKLFADLAATQTGDSQAFQAAANGVETLLRVVEKSRAVKPRLPMTLQVWRDGDETQVRFSADACGASFEPGEIRYASHAESCALYVESTRFCNSSEVDCRGVPDAVLDIVSGVYLTLDEGLKDRASMGMMLMKLFRPQIRGVCNALSQIRGGLSSPMALMLGRGGQRTVSGALRLSVTNRSAVEGGWRDLIDQLKTIAGMVLSTPPEQLDNLPVLSQDEPDGAVRYALAFPIADGACEPQLVLGDGKLVLATDRAAADALSRDSGSGEPFCGAVFALNVDELLHISDGRNNATETGKSAGRIGGQVTVQDGTLLIKMQVIDK